VLRAYAGGRLFGAPSGTGAPDVLALHGWGRSHRDFDAVLAGVGPPLDAVALDLPGFGATPPPDQPWGSADYAAVVARVLDEMAPPVVVVGHSFGGTVAVQLAAAHPAAVRALVLTGVPRLAPGGPRRRPPTAFRGLRWLHRVGLLSESRMDTARQRYGSADYRAAEGVMRQVLVRSLAETLEGPLGRLSCAVELVWGDDDTAAPLAGAEAAQALVPGGARLTVCPGAGHLTPLSAPDALRAAIERARR
jgi:pimeloyl-ACP methyl ester carboxylesterase